LPAARGHQGASGAGRVFRSLAGPVAACRALAALRCRRRGRILARLRARRPRYAAARRSLQRCNRRPGRHRLHSRVVAVRRLALLLALALLPATATAQVRGLPVVNSGFGLGAGIAGDLGFANDAAGGGTTIGATASAGLGIIGITGSISRGEVNGKSVWSQGGSVSMRVFGGPLIPFRVTVQGGLAFWDEGIVEALHVPVSLGLAAVIPNPVFAIRPWIAPRIDYLSTTFENSEDSRTEFGISGGIELGFLSGLTLRTAYDRLLVDGDPGIFSIGVGMSLGR